MAASTPTQLPLLAPSDARLLPAGTVAIDHADRLLAAGLARLAEADEAWERFCGLSSQRDALYWRWYRSSDKGEREMLAAQVVALDPHLNELWRRAWML